MQRFSNPNSILAFVTVAREGNVSRAAEVLNLTQPAISHQIRRLSEETEITLFRRTPHGLDLTPDGKALLPKAEHVLNAMIEFRQSANRQAGLVSGTLRIGTIVDPEFIRLGRLLSRLGDAHPGITTELVHGISGEILERLKRRQIDAGYYLTAPEEVDNIPSEEAVHVRVLAKFNYCVIAPAGWEARVGSAAWEELAPLPWIGTTSVSVHNRLLSRIFAERGCTQNTVALVDHEASMLEMVRSGVGLSLCRESIALDQRQSFGLSMCENLRVPACLVMLALDARKEAPVIAALFDQLETVWH
ncbi:LysR family transcriptional regulator [Mameliella sediminis]|uniref:LysR family transcriptional regulator n=1 Tax=Mameliella sediminis TaxID=2836866 RepID=UPI001C45CD0E|nr:LysR family transcriptional regulator [Mameliella sediminis]MBV7396865.1 LysR family transcriptional regulator [Mameliella sediminis]MBY6116177.1 LysR family transcriptional regulator [Antarctobacter heliothermus]MBY6146142.1 LysR family transcriptional regulator [Mameliella alba]MCA0955327.1 LysR family transcriptional regulator [Mameliella alba]